MYQSDMYTLPASLAGLPSMSLPAGMHNELPVGMQLISNHFVKTNSYKWVTGFNSKQIGILLDPPYQMMELTNERILYRHRPRSPAQLNTRSKLFPTPQRVLAQKPIKLISWI